jgi:monoamine oxidase
MSPPSPDLSPTPLARKGRPKKILVLGAGVAGLCAAAELTTAGHDVTLLEARSRPGGRVWTLREPFTPGLYAEAGATFFPAGHTFTLHYVRQFQLGLRPLPRGSAATAYLVRGRRLGFPMAAATAWPLELTPKEHKLGLPGLVRQYVVPLLDRLGSRSRDVPCPAELYDLDARSMAEALRQQGASPAAVELLGLGVLDQVGDGLGTVSALFSLRDLLADRFNPALFAVVGGNDQLAAAFARLLGRRILYNHRIEALTQHPGSVDIVATFQGERRVFSAEYVICTLPCPVLVAVEVTPAFSSARARAIRELASTSVTRVYLQSRSRFWDTGAGLVQAFTDLDLMTCRDAAYPCPGPRGILETCLAGPCGRGVSELPEDERLRWALAAMEQVFPGIGAAFECGTSVCWDQEPFSRGAYAWFRPGQLASVQPFLLPPEGRVHFAGEHTSPWPGWVQGALHSGCRVAREIQERS